MTIKQSTLLKMQKSFQEIFAERQEYLSAIVYGPSGSGKTYSLKTCVHPTLIHSFDRGGCQSLFKEVKEGKILVDSSFENENPKAPSAWSKWEKAFDKLTSENIFNELGTYVIDSFTLWSDAAMYEVLAREKQSIAEGNIRMRDWGLQMNLLYTSLKKILSKTNCNVIILAHSTTEKDEITGKIDRTIDATGKLRNKLPILFDECYTSYVKSSSKEVKFLWNTLPHDLYGYAKTRIGKGGIGIAQDYKKLLKDAGKSFEDKKLITE